MNQFISPRFLPFFLIVCLIIFGGFGLYLGLTGGGPWVFSTSQLKHQVKINLLSQIKNSHSPRKKSLMLNVLSRFSDPLDLELDLELLKKRYLLNLKEMESMDTPRRIGFQSRLDDLNQYHPLQVISGRIRSLSGFSDPVDLEILLHPYVNSADPFVRQAAIRALCVNPSEKKLLPYVNSPDEYVRHAAIGALVCGNPIEQNILLAKRDIESALLKREYVLVEVLTENGTDRIQYSVEGYDCLSGPIPKEKPLADLWRWIQKKDRELNPNSWPYKRGNEELGD
ncbi:MAG: HEAT repeat domain-containing protein [Elusimicrobia bacterium]|nr:HEAT repeat domain-containing protein [Elusimicrobiota bacterium]